MSTNDQLIRAVQLATRTLAKSGHFDSLLKDVLRICVGAVGADGGTIYLHDPMNGTLRFQHVLPESVLDSLPMRDIPDDYGMAGQAFQSRATVIKELVPDADGRRTEFEEATGVTLRSMIAVPLMLEDEEPIGVVQMLNKASGSFNDTDVSVMDTVAAVCTLAYLNSKLTEDATKASTLLGMGKVSHDIGNLAASLHANLSFTHLSLDEIRHCVDERGTPELKRSVGELDNGLEELKNSVDRIVGYSRLISDLSAGRTLRPTKTLRSLGATVENAASYLEPEARRSGVRLAYSIEAEGNPTLHDELYVGRIVQNLVGNAIKAVKETIPPEVLDAREDDDATFYGEVQVDLHQKGAFHELRVRDTGPGMPPEIINKILSGNARSQWVNGGGSGWGTRIVLELASTHDATVGIESTPGEGSTFLVRFPHCA